MIFSQDPSNTAAEFCDKLKLSEFVNIQPYGCLLVIDQDFKLRYYSENVPHMLEISLEELLSHSPIYYLSLRNPEDHLMSWLAGMSTSYRRVDWQIASKRIPAWARLHRSADLIFIELELDNLSINADQQAASADPETLAQIDENVLFNGIEGVAQIYVREIKKLTAFDRVLVYKFKDYSSSGVVIAEASDPDLDSMLGLQFPASDVPKAVREMYLYLPLRYIPNVSEKSLAVISTDSSVNQSKLDISFTGLRSLAPVHMEYLINMKMVASMSIAIIHEEKLWGLITCHARKPRYLPVELRMTLVDMANNFSGFINAADLFKSLQFKARQDQLKSRLMASLAQKDSACAAIDGCQADIIALMCVSGFSICREQDIQSYGDTPTTKEIQSLISWLQTKGIDERYSSSCLHSEFQESLAYKNIACGLLAFKTSASKNEYLLFYRAEHVYSITWAGNPHQALKITDQGYSPRGSFKPFGESFPNYSLPWVDNDINLALFIRSLVVNYAWQGS